MKKIYTLLLAVAITASAYAQYYYLPYSLGKNPGNLNNDNEYPVGAGIPAGWTVALGPSASPAWSNTLNIPFTFNFSGTDYTAFKVSNSGVLTFSVTPDPAPAFANAPIPSSLIPDSSIMVWGIEGTGNNDNVVTKTFGTSPNRQYWISFSSYSKGNLYTYWAIVLEETTNNIYIVDQRHAATVTDLTVGIQINDTTAYGVNNGDATVDSKAGSNFTPADNHYYEFIQGIQPQYDISVKVCSVPDFVAIGDAPFNITGEIINYGLDTVNSYTLNYSVNGDPAVSGNVNSVNILSYASSNFTHTIQWSPSSTGNYSIKIWVSDINGTNADMNNGNDTLTKNVFVASNLVQRKVLYEQFTSSTCVPCASSDPTISGFLSTNGANTDGGKIVAIKYHMNYPSPGTDAAYTNESRIRHDYYGVTGIPRAVVGGNTYNGNPAMLTQSQNIIDNEYNRPAIFELNLTNADASGNTVTISGNYMPYADMSAGLILHVAIIEDEIDKGIHTFYTGATTNQQVFKYVMRKMLPNASGTTMPALTANQSVPFDFTYTFSNNSVFSGMDGLTAIAFIQNNANQEIYQASYKKISSDVGIQEESSVARYSIYPNPFNEFTNIDLELKESNNVNISLYNSMGQVVYNESKGWLGQGEYLIRIPKQGLASGIYFVNISIGKDSIMRKVAISE